MAQNEVEIRVKVTQDGRGFSQIRQDAAREGRSSGQAFSSGLVPGLNQSSSAFGEVGGAAASAGGAARGFGGAMPLIAAGAAVAAVEVVRLAGAALALPGAFAGAAAAFGAFRVATAGVGDAISALWNPPKGGGGGGGGGAGAAAAAAARQIRDALDSVNDARRREAQVAEDTARSIYRAERNKARVAREVARDIADAKRDEERIERDNARSIADALQSQQDATEQLTRAREDAAQKLEDLRDKVHDYAVDEDGARLRVLAAYAAQRKVNADSQATNLDRAQALQNVREAEQRLADLQRNRAQDTAKLAQEEAKGVEGSDEVTAAKQRLSDAEQRVADARDTAAERQAAAERKVADAVEQGAQRQQAAQENLDDTIRESERQRANAHEAVAKALQQLKDAQADAARSAGAAAGGTNAYAAALAKLSPNARAFVEALRELKPQLDALQRSVQDKFFAGFADGIKELAAVYIPVLEQGLGRIAQGMNTMILTVGKGLIDPAIVDAVRSIMEDTAKFFENAAPGLRDFIQGFLLLAQVGAQYLPDIGTWVSEIGAAFKSWVESGVSDGTFQAFIEDAAKAFHDLWDIAVLVGQSIVAILSGLGFGGKGGDGGLLAALKGNAQAFADWVKSPGVQGALATLGEIFRWCMDHLPAGMQIASTGLRILAGVFGWWRDNVWPIIGAVAGAVRDFGGWVGRVAGDVRGILAGMGAAWDGFRARVIGVIDGISGRLRGMWDFLAPALRGAANAAIAVLNRFIGGANVAIGGLNLLPGVHLGSIPYVGYLAKGGIASGLAVVGERGPELVRLPAGSTVYPANQSHRMAEQAGASAGAAPSALEIRFGGNTDGALASAFMQLVRTGQIELQPTA